MWGLYKSMFIAAASVMRCHENLLHKGPAAAGLFPLKNYFLFSNYVLT